MITGSLQNADPQIPDVAEDPDHGPSGSRRRRLLAAQAAASAGGLLSLTTVLLGSPALADQTHAVRLSSR